MASFSAVQPLSFLNVPGLGGSGPAHWQTLWEERHSGFRRVRQENWDDPVRRHWVGALHEAIVSSDGPVILVAHSLGCLTVAWWAAEIAQGYGRPVAGALMVAPPEVHGPDAHPLLRRFAPLPLQPLPFPSILVASRNDDYATIEQSRRMAGTWQSRFVDVGERGHINAASGLGGWEEGRALLDDLAAAHESRGRPSARLTPPRTIEISSRKQAWG